MHLQIDRGHLDELAAAMTELANAGRGWINLMPDEVDPSELAATRSVPGMIFGRFSGRGAPTPKITWTAPELRRTRIDPAVLGIEHPGGPKARQQLAAAGHPVPSAWRVLQDHSLRGLVVVPLSGDAADTPNDPATRHAEIITWALDAATILAGRDLGPAWQAQVFEGR